MQMHRGGGYKKHGYNSLSKYMHGTCTHPDTLERRLEGAELTAERPVILLVSENRSTSLSSAT